MKAKSAKMYHNGSQWVLEVYDGETDHIYTLGDVSRANAEKEARRYGVPGPWTGDGYVLRWRR